MTYEKNVLNEKTAYASDCLLSKLKLLWMRPGGGSRPGCPYRAPSLGLPCCSRGYDQGRGHGFYPGSRSEVSTCCQATAPGGLLLSLCTLDPDAATGGPPPLPSWRKPAGSSQE